MRPSRKGMRYDVTGRKKRGRTLTLEERYQRYISQLEKRLKSLIRRGFTPKIYDQYGEEYRLTEEEFKTSYETLKEQGLSATNAVRQLVSNQLYGASDGDKARTLLTLLEAYDVESPTDDGWSLLGLKTRDFEEGVSRLNKRLKELGNKSGVWRKQFISHHIYGSD